MPGVESPKLISSTANEIKVNLVSKPVLPCLKRHPIAAPPQLSRSVFWCRSLVTLSLPIAVATSGSANIDRHKPRRCCEQFVIEPASDFP